MTDVTLLQNKVNRGKQAEGLLGDPLFKEIGEACRKEWFKAFAGDDEDKAGQARHEVRAFQKFLTKIVNIHKEGIAAHKKIEELRLRESKGESMDPNDLQGIV